MSDKGQWVGKLNAIEEEVVILNAVAELIDSIVNPGVLGPMSEDTTQVMFPTRLHKAYFNIMLVDLLSKTDRKGPIKGKTYLSCLASIAEKPHFNVCGSVNNLAKTTHQFRTWLNTTFAIEDAWLPSIDKHVSLTMKRLDLIKIGGNIFRHNPLRAVGIAGDVRKIFTGNGIQITLEQTLRALPDLNEHLHGDVFSYHSSTIVEFLNNIRWGTRAYFEPELKNGLSIRKIETHVIFNYNFPNKIKNDIAKDAYRGLINGAKHKPPVPQFKVTETLKEFY